MLRSLSWTLLLLASALAAELRGLDRAAPDDSGVELFETRIRPLLADRCVECHGPDVQKSGLRLDRYGSILAGGERGPAVVPGEPERSPLVLAVRQVDPELSMPPKGRLEEAQIAELEAWVAAGAPGPAGEALAAPPAGVREEFDLEERKRHWALQPVQDVEPPAAPGASPVDAFVRARLAEAGLEPAPPAERRSWIRRVHFDLIGLPPSPAEVAAFLADESPDAKATVVDRLLASPHFGEKWARHWLDLVRYAETRGHEFDYRIPNAYQYRDYVIRAFNADLPYDRFALEHVAGDLVEEPRPNPEGGWDESVLGTGFWFLGEEVHSPVDIRGDETERVANRLDVFSKTFLGLTLACARCHDHKFDAIRRQDYYAAAGFTLSTSYRQVRFETREHNGRVASELEALAARHRPAVAGAVGEALARDAERVPALLLAAREALEGPDDGAAIDPRAAGAIDLLFADFEDAGHGDWQATGTAFGAGPVAAAELPGYQGDVGARGRRLVNSHHARGGEDTRRADEHQGTLTSPAFPIERDYVHFLIGGGAHEGRTCLELLVDGEVVQSATGRNENRLRPGRFDVRALRGRAAALRIADRESGGWGNVGVDHVVFSDDPEPGALAVALRPAEEAARWSALARAAASRGVEPAELAAWVEAVRGAGPGDPLHAWRLLVEGSAPPPPAPEPGTARVLVDFGAPTPTDWLPDGPVFGSGPVPAGTPLLGSDASRPLAGVTTRGAARSDPVWEVLRLAGGTERDPGRVDWEQPGRTLHTPTFTLGSGRLAYLVRGAGRVYAAVDSHRLVQGPLHGRVVRAWDAGDGGYRWIEHDLTDYAGHRVHLEFSPGDGGELALARVVESDDPLPPPDPAWRCEATEPAALAAEYGARFGAAARALAGGAGLETGQAQLLDWWVRRPELAPSPARSERVAALTAAWLDERGALRARIRPASHTAPAALEGSRVDEFDLVRGSHHTPGEPVPRRFLEALAGPGPASTASGSARLELARQLVDPANPLTARVFVNRVWHHLFGRGLVASVDDFGVMGERPSHPELLDWLARRFVEGGWRLKPLVRELVLTDTYGQASAPGPRAAELDPTNALLSHARVRRLTGEAVRDAVLAVSGRLDPALHGPPVELHLTDFLQGRGRPSASGPLDGDGRRSVYLAVRRNFLDPLLAVFDYPVPATTRGRRSVSNVPAQALALMNSPFVAGEARRWAERVLAGEGSSPEERVDGLYRAAYARPATAEERAAALAFVAGQGERRGAETDAWADLCHVLFNVKEFLYLD